MQSIRVAVQRLRSNPNPLPLPRYMTAGAAGMDLLADIEQPLEIKPGQRLLVPTGLAVALPQGFEAQIRPRSGLALKHGLTLPNAPGTIDCDYRGEIQIILLNLGDQPYVIERGERIAQMVIAPVVQAALELVEELPSTERGSGGFGHSGRGEI
jgi:dUTP pyrophosphatase